MSEFVKPDAQFIGRMYDQRVVQYTDFADNSYTWKYIERPALKRYLEGIISPDSCVLDIGTGTGRVVKLLTELGVHEANITGLDVSEELIKATQLNYPDARFIHDSADNFSLPPDSFDLVTANMVFQYLDNNMLRKAIDNIYKVLRIGGKLCFIEPHPLHNEDAKKGENNDRWVDQLTPWGDTVPTFNRDPYSLLDALELGGFNLVSGWETLKVQDDGLTDTTLYDLYSKKYSRAGYLWIKIDEETKKFRNDPNYKIPSLI